MNLLKYFLCISLGASVFSSCSSSEDDEAIIDDGYIRKTLTVSMTNEDTRLAIKEGTTGTITWQDKDQIAVWRKDDNAKYEFTLSSMPYPNDPNWATFVCDKFPQERSERIVVAYPNTTATTYNQETNKLTVAIPEHQKAVPNSFDPMAAVCSGATSSANDQTVELKHVCGFLKFTLQYEAQSVKIESVTTNGSPYAVCGPIQVEPKTAGSAPTVNNQTYSSVDLTANSGNIQPGSYLVAILPSSSYEKFKITVTYGENVTTQVLLQPSHDTRFLKKQRMGGRSPKPMIACPRS